MSTTAKIIKYELHDVIRSRWLIAYGAFFFLITDALLRFSDTGAKALLSLTNVVLFIIPLVSAVFGTMYLYNAREFTELLLAQPVSRRQMFGGLLLGLALPLSLGFLAGFGIPVAMHGLDDPALRGTVAALAGSGLALTFIFVALAMLIAVRMEDKVKGLGAAIGLWLAFAVLYDGFVMLAATMFADYPLERPMLALMLANPVDLARVVLMLQFDVSALMGYTGAVFEKFFGSGGGIALAVTVLALWVAVPATLALRRFGKKDF
ncbi:MAG TPA: ABC transporter permease subunit [Gemmatimonadaceae bacterium]|nr:ABC transporter permease subunit [Gemmatimonadaceae bacterium]